MKWREMTGPERYRVVEMARKGQRPLTEICRTFEVSRQALSKAMERASRAAMEALEPQKPGRKGRSEEEQRIGELLKKTTGLEKKVNHWKTRYEVAQAFIDLTREAEGRQERSRKKKKRRGPPEKVSVPGSSGLLAPVDDGGDAGDKNPESGALGDEA